jgi:hypothetical protein
MEGIDLGLIEYTVEPYKAGGLRGFQIHTGGQPLGRIYSNEADAILDAGKSIQFYVDFWTQRLGEKERDDIETFVVDQWHYIKGDENDWAPAMRGYGGRQFWFRDLATGEITTSTNVWSQGRVPDWFTKYLPNTHELVYPVPGKDGEYTTDTDIAFPPRTLKG